MRFLIAWMVSSVVTLAAGPNSIANLSLALEGERLAMDVGADITSWADGYGGSVTVTPPGTAPKKATFRGLAVCRFAGSDRLTTSSFLDSSYDTAFSICYVSYTTNTGLRAVACNTDASTLWFGNNTSASSMSSAPMWNQTGVVPAVSVGNSIGLGQVITWVYDGSTLKLYVNKTPWSTNAGAGTLGVTGALSIGATPSGTLPYNGDLRALYVYKRALSAAEVGVIVDYRVALDAGFAGQDTFMFIGDSHSGPGNATVTYPQLVKRAFDTNSIEQNYFFGSTASGRTLEIMESVAPVEVDRYIAGPNLALRNVLIVLGGANSISAGDSPAQAHAVLQTLCEERKAASGSRLKVVAVTTPYGTNDSTAMRSNRMHFNALILTNSPFLDRVVDIMTNAPLQDPSSATYYYDGTHWTDAGKAIVASNVFSALTTPWDSYRMASGNRANVGRISAP